MTATVVHVLGTLDRGGAESVALDLCRRIPAAEIRQVFLTLGTREGRLAPRFREAGAVVDRCPVRPLALFVPLLWRRLGSVRPDVVVSHVSLVSGLVLAVAGAAGVPVRIARLHSEGDGRPATARRRLQRAVLRAALRRSATAVLGVTSAALAFAGPADGDRRYRVVPNGVDTDRFTVTDRPSGAPVFVHIGRAAPEKNRGFLLQVHAEARQLCAETTLVVAGPGGIADLEAAMPTVAADPSVCLVGETDQVEEVLASGDVLLLPSYREGLPGVVLEALAAGVPVLASDLPGLRELAGQLAGITLIPLAAGPLAWARTALRLAATPMAQRREISAGIRGSGFALERCVATWSQLWTSR